MTSFPTHLPTFIEINSQYPSVDQLECSSINEKTILIRYNNLNNIIFINKKAFFELLECSGNNDTDNSFTFTSCLSFPNILNNFIKTKKNLFRITFNGTYTFFARHENLEKSGSYFANYTKNRYPESQENSAQIEILHTNNAEEFFNSKVFEIIRIYLTTKNPKMKLEKVVTPEVLPELFEFHRAMNISGIISTVLQLLNFFTNNMVSYVQVENRDEGDGQTISEQPKCSSLYDFVCDLAKHYGEPTVKEECDEHYRQILTIEKIIKKYPMSKAKFSFNTHSNVDFSLSIGLPNSNNQLFSEHCANSLKVVEEIVNLENHRCDSIIIDLSALSQEIHSLENNSTTYLQEILGIISSYIPDSNVPNLHLVITGGNIALFPYGHLNDSNKEFEVVLVKIASQFKSISFTDFNCTDDVRNIPRLMNFFEVSSIPGYSIDGTFHYHNSCVRSSVKLSAAIKPNRSICVKYYQKDFDLQFLPTTNFTGSRKGPIDLIVEQTNFVIQPWLARGLKNVLFSQLTIRNVLIDPTFINEYQKTFSHDSTTFHLIHFANCKIGDDAKQFLIRLEQNNIESEIWFQFNKKIKELNDLLKDEGILELGCESLEDRKLRLNIKVNDGLQSDFEKLTLICLSFLRKFSMEEQLNIHCIHIDLSKVNPKLLLEESTQIKNDNDLKKIYKNIKNPYFESYKNKKLLISIPTIHIHSLEHSYIDLLLKRFYSISIQIFGSIDSATINKIYASFSDLKKYDKTISVIEKSSRNSTSTPFFEVTFSKSIQKAKIQLEISSLKSYSIDREQLNSEIVIKQQGAQEYNLSTSPTQSYFSQILRNNISYFKRKI